ncbi:hypothetical protein JTE90_019445 [Oedothorax gibbosus]|uniref:Uncharacterized protein n=1 Tax=Oedothorax gibbosus TaxID=931172 RepID=A0AAV6UXD6_9ARAC|nr:hypothetical protein JTE90_019445 [Oedothorax gibbosus]
MGLGLLDRGRGHKLPFDPNSSDCGRLLLADGDLLDCRGGKAVGVDFGDVGRGRDGCWVKYLSGKCSDQIFNPVYLSPKIRECSNLYTDRFYPRRYYLELLLAFNLP